MILGAGGFLGSRLCKSLRNNEIIKCGRDKKNDIILDKTKKNNFTDILLKVKPDVIINLIAIADVDSCERKKEEANKVNNIMVKKFVRTIKESKLTNKIFFYIFQPIRFILEMVPIKKTSLDLKIFMQKQNLKERSTLKK